MLWSNFYFRGSEVNKQDEAVARGWVTYLRRLWPGTEPLLPKYRWDTFVVSSALSGQRVVNVLHLPLASAVQFYS